MTSPYDIKIEEWATANDDGIWCTFCGELLVSSHQIDEDTEAPENCRTCGAPDDAEAMTEYFT